MSSETFGGSQLGRMCGYVVVSATNMSLKSMDLLSPFPKSVLWLTPSKETTAQVVRYTRPGLFWGNHGGQWLPKMQPGHKSKSI